MNYTNPYFNNYQPMQYGNQFYQPQQMQQQLQQRIQPEQFMNINKPVSLQGKVVDNVDVVKATDIPLDGSVSYFPLTDGTAIVTKQLQQDGTSKIIVYKPTEDKNVDNITAFITSNELEDRLSKIKPVDYKEDIKKLNRQIEDLADEIEKINKGLKKRKED